ncbi:MAG: hypothetical protein RBS68_13635 [Anaerolineales bacterium]|jgi:hypothetical protein|nr:hypothetical protein [Anaerolineales bacterium]
MKNFMDFLLSLFSEKKPAQPAPTPLQPVNPNLPQPAAIIIRKVLMVVYDPLVEPATGKKLSQVMKWQPVDNLSAGYIADILETSGGLARYQVVERVEVDDFPLKADGFRYTAQSYGQVLAGKSPHHQPDLFNYEDFIQKFDILKRVANNEIDEIWIFAFPYAGLYESAMGGLGAFWCNSQPLARTLSCSRRFVIMGFSYERGVGEMLESFGHRAESIMEKVYAREAPQNNLWQKFIRHDKSHPGKSECGDVHFAPNSDQDYDWGNPRLVNSFCDDWYQFPNFSGLSKRVNAKDWGNGDIRAHHKWWLNHFPKVGGRLNGIANNWWQYILDPNRISI